MVSLRQRGNGVPLFIRWVRERSVSIRKTELETDMRLHMTVSGLMALIGLVLTGASATAQESLRSIGKPEPRGTGFQPAVTELARDLHWLDNMVLIIISVISVFVMLLLLIVILRYNRRANPEPAAFTHNSQIEVAWTLIPVVILVFVGAFSLPALFKQQEIPEADLTIKATGYQWYWGYEYPEEGLAFESFMLGSPQAVENAGYSPDEFLLATDTAVVIPTGKTIVVQVTGADVIHAWTIPSFGVKQDAVPGRLAELWFKVDEGNEGIYFGQCSELCGKDHSFMPITVMAVTQEDYEAWLAGPAQEFAVNDRPETFKVAAAD